MSQIELSWAMYKTHKFLDKTFEFLKDRGVIHYHETVAEKIMYERPIEIKILC